MKFLVAVAMIAACGDQEVSTVFEVHDTLDPNPFMITDVIELRVDGVLVPQGPLLHVDETYPSYEEAKAQFVPRTVELVTQAGTQTKLIGLGICDGLPGSECPGGAVCHQTQISEEVSYRISNLFDGSASFVGTTKVRCAFANGNSLGFIE